MRAKTLKAMDHRGMHIGAGTILDTDAPETSLFSLRMTELRTYLDNKLVTTEGLPVAPDMRKVFKDWPQSTRRV